MIKAGFIAFAAGSLLFGAAAARALTPSDLLEGYEASARRASTSLGRSCGRASTTRSRIASSTTWAAATCTKSLK